LSEESLRQALTPIECIKARTLTGGPAPERVEEDIARARKQYATDENTFAEISQRLVASESRLEQAIDQIIG